MPDARKPGPNPGSALRRDVVERWLKGEAVSALATELGVSPQRIRQHLARARALNEATVRMQILNVEGVEPEALAAYLRRCLAAAGVSTSKE